MAHEGMCTVAVFGVGIAMTRFIFVVSFIGMAADGTSIGGIALFGAGGCRYDARVNASLLSGVTCIVQANETVHAVLERNRFAPNVGFQRQLLMAGKPLFATLAVDARRVAMCAAGGFCPVYVGFDMAKRGDDNARVVGNENSALCIRKPIAAGADIVSCVARFGAGGILLADSSLYGMRMVKRRCDFVVAKRAVDAVRIGWCFAVGNVCFKLGCGIATAALVVVAVFGGGIGYCKCVSECIGVIDRFAPVAVEARAHGVAACIAGRRKHTVYGFVSECGTVISSIRILLFAEKANVNDAAVCLTSSRCDLCRVAVVGDRQCSAAA